MENDLEQRNTKLNELESESAKKASQIEQLVQSLDEVTKKYQETEISTKKLQDEVEIDKNDLNRQLGVSQEKISILNENLTVKDTLIADLKNNLENIQACLKSKNSENESSSDLMQQLNETISSRDLTIEDLRVKVYSVEKVNKEIEDQLRNIMVANDQTAKESKSKISELLEQVTLLEQVKEKEVEELSSKLSFVQSQLNIFESSAEASKTNLKTSQQRENDFLLKIKDLELKEAELMLLNQSMNRRVEELETMKGISRKGDVYDQEMQSHVEFLNSIIADMHKKNLKLTQQVELLGVTSSSLDQSG